MTRSWRGATGQITQNYHNGEIEMSSGMQVATPNIVYAWARTKEDFDKIDIEESVFAWKECETTTLLKNDGKKWERRCRAKLQSGHVDVIFQWHDERPIEE